MIVSLVYPPNNSMDTDKYYGFHDVARLLTVFMDGVEVLLNGDT